MELDPGFNLPESTTRRLYVLDWIHDRDSPGELVGLADLFGQSDDEQGKRSLAQLIRDLANNGLLQLFDTMGWEGWSVQLTPSGEQFVEKVRRARADTIGRRQAARDAVLRWLYEQKVAGNPMPVAHHMGASPYAIYYGAPFAIDELTQAADWLKEQGYITGQGSFPSGIPRPSITSKGETAVERRISVNDDAPAAARTDGSLSGATINAQNVNIMSNSPGSTQSITITQQIRNEVSGVADTLEALLDLLGLSAADRAAAGDLVVELRAASADETVSTGTLAKLLSQAKAIAVAGTAKAIGSGVVAAAELALHHIGVI